MPSKWRVTHYLREPLPYASGPTTYAEEGITLVLEAGKIARLEHELTVEADNPSESEVVVESHQRLTLLREILEFKSHGAAHMSRQTAVCLDKPPESRGLTLPMLTFSATGTVRTPIDMPDALPKQSTRLAVWLRLANLARLAPSPADAIRNYYLIWEDKRGRPKSGPGAVLKLVRDFVSHGKVNNPDLLALLEREIGRPVTQYDPHDPDQARFLERHRRSIRQLIAREIEQMLG